MKGVAMNDCESETECKGES